MADPGFPVGGADLVGGRQLPRRLHFEKFVCQNERMWTLGGGASGAPPGSANGFRCKFRCRFKYVFHCGFWRECWLKSVKICGFQPKSAGFYRFPLSVTCRGLCWSKRYRSIKTNNWNIYCVFVLVTAAEQTVGVPLEKILPWFQSQIRHSPCKFRC